MMLRVGGPLGLRIHDFRSQNLNIATTTAGPRGLTCSMFQLRLQVVLRRIYNLIEVRS
jgi:hypothetical protein